MDLCMMLPGSQAPFLFPLFPQRGCPRTQLGEHAWGMGGGGPCLMFNPQFLLALFFSIKENLTLWGSLRHFGKRALEPGVI